MKTWIRIVGVIVIALVVFAIPVLCTLSFVLAWGEFMQVFLVCTCIVEFLGVASCVDDMGDE